MMKQFTPPLSNILSRTFKIRGRDTGTAFVVDVLARQYLVTALHLIDEQENKLAIFHRDNWLELEVVRLASDPVNDLAIFAASRRLGAKEMVVDLSMEHLILGQHTFFLGYPYADFGTIELAGFEGRAMPFVKWAGVASIGFTGTATDLVLDGYNNPGFSGVPIGFTDEQGIQRICGMVRGFKEEEKFVEPFSSEIASNLVYKQNTGLMYATSAKVIKDLIATNPLGFELE